jgi:hypothetical protein
MAWVWLCGIAFAVVVFVLATRLYSDGDDS